MDNAAPIEKVAVDPDTLGKAVLALGAAVDVPLGATPTESDELSKDLDEARVKTKPHSNGARYLAEHDVIRTANRIFGYGRWGTQVVSNELIGAHPVTNSKGQEGWYVGYRCTVRLTVAGCVPVDGCGYGDAFEKQWSAIVSAHELAYKEAESDAIKRAFKKLGDQFGLILYAKAEDLARIERDKAEAAAANQTDEQKAAALAEKQAPIIAEWKQHDDKPATDEDVQGVIDLAAATGDDGLINLATTTIEKQQEKYAGLVSAKWLAKLSDRVSQLAAEAGVQAKEAAEQFKAAA